MWHRSSTIRYWMFYHLHWIEQSHLYDIVLSLGLEENLQSRLAFWWKFLRYISRWNWNAKNRRLRTKFKLNKKWIQRYITIAIYIFLFWQLQLITITGITKQLVIVIVYNEHLNVTNYLYFSDQIISFQIEQYKCNNGWKLIGREGNSCFHKFSQAYWR